MIFQNQQANILRVNGALADILANQPNAEGTYYIFYSLDTQEIYYDESPGNWIRLGSGGGGVGTNIYNSDGTLTSTRKLNGNKNDLEFNNCGLVKFWSFNNAPLSSGVSINITDTNNSYCSFGISPTQILWGVGINNINSLQCFFNPATYSIDFQFNNKRQGLYFKYDTRLYQLGQINDFNQTRFIIDDLQRTIETRQGGGQTIGIRFDFGARVFDFGQISGGNFNWLRINDINQTVSIFNLAFERGLKLDFVNRLYQFGQINGNNTTTIEINDLDVNYPIRISGTNTTSNIVGLPSGQYLKLRVKGIDYKIQLFNP